MLTLTFVPVYGSPRELVKETIIKTMTPNKATKHLPKCNWGYQRHQSKCGEALHVKHESIQEKHKNQIFILY